MFLFVRNCDGYLLVGDIEQEVKGVARGCTKCLHGSAKPIKIGLGKGDVAVCPKGTLNNESLISDELRPLFGTLMTPVFMSVVPATHSNLMPSGTSVHLDPVVGTEIVLYARAMEMSVGEQVPEGATSVADGLNEVAKYPR